MEIRNFSDKIIPNFPQDVVLEILARLPLRSLLRFKSICKSWCSMITSQHFIDSHLTVSTKVIFATGSSSSASPYTIKCCSLNSLISGTAYDDAQTIDFDFPLKNHNSIQIVGCCDDLICIVISCSYFCLWNQSTRKLKKLPDWDNKLNRDFTIHSYGFGCDDSNGDYKVFASLRFSYEQDEPPEYRFHGPYEVRKYHDHEMKVYSLRSNSWNRIVSYDRCFYYDDGLPLNLPGKFVGGNLHWGKRTGYASRPQVVSLDLVNEVWKCTGFPVRFMGSVSKSLGIFGGCLAMLPELTNDVWILKENKVWEKVFRFPCSYHLKEPSSATPVCILSDGRIVYLQTKMFYFLIYDPKEKSVDRVMLKSSNMFGGADVYIKSFYSSTCFFLTNNHGQSNHST